MDFVRSDNCHRIRNRAARSLVRDPSVQQSFEKLGEHHRGTRAHFTDESSLVELVRVSLVGRTGFDLDEHRSAEKRRARPWRRTLLRPSHRHVFPHHLAGAMGIFFVLIFALALPALLAPIKSSAVVWIAFVLSIFPILRDWDERLWPNEAQLAGRVERRIESAQIRDLALSLRSPEVHPFLAPWWLSPSIAYWSGQPGVAGSSHESLNGIEESARFFLSENLEQAREILDKHRVAWVLAYDSDRVAQNSAAVVNQAVPLRPLCRVLYQTPSQAPPFLIFSAQNPTCKLYRAAVER